MLFGTAEELVIAKVRGQLNVNTAEGGNSSTTTPGSTTATPRKNSNTRHNTAGDCKRHHCRSCGQAVCEHCSKTRRPVPERGWPTDVRVCDSCACVENKSKMD